jgi:hypothetical protein
MKSYVPAILLSYVMLFVPHFTKPSWAYFGGYLLSLLITRGRKTMSRVADTCFFIDRHLSSWERFLSENKWDLSAVLDTLTQAIIDKMGGALKVHGAYLAALDPTLIAKNGEQMPGVQRWKDHSGNADRGPTIRGHHWTVLGLIGFSTVWGCYVCFPLLVRLISGQINPCQFFVDPQGTTTVASFWGCIHPMIWQLQDLLGDAPLRVVADAYFSKAPFANPLVEAGIDVVSKLRCDAVGWDDPTPDQRSDAKRGKKWKLAHLLDHLPVQSLTVHLYGETVEVRAVSRILQLRNFKRKVKVVVTKGAKGPIILLTTDLSLSAAQIIEIYGARYRIELAIRDLKQHFGLADYQCYLGTAIHRFAHLACVAFSIFRLIQLREDTSDWLPPVPDDVSPASFTHLRQGLQRHIIQRILAPKFGENANLEDSSPELEAIMRVVG